MSGRFGGMNSALVKLTMFGALGLVVGLSAMGRDSEDDFTAAPDNPEHAKNCDVCRSPNHFGGLMPGPAPSAEILNRMFSEKPVSETAPNYEEDDLDFEADTIETASHRKFKTQSDDQKANVLHSRTSVRKPSAS